MALIPILGGNRVAAIAGVFQAFAAPPTNPAPTDIDLSTLTFSETSAGAVAGNTVIATILVTDPGEVSWWAAVTGGTHAAQFDIINSPSGAPTLIAKSGNTMNAAGSPYSVQITVTDSAGGTRIETFSLTLTAVADNALIASLTLVNTSGSTVAANSLTPMVGHTFKQGDFPTGTAPVFKTTGGTTARATYRIAARWPDGSIRRIAACWLVWPASIAGNGTATVEIRRGGSPPAPSSRSTSNLSTRDLKAILTGVEALSGTWTSALNTGISDADDLKVVADGQAGKLWRIRQQCRDASSNHGQLECYHYVAAREDESGALADIIWLPRVVQPWLDVDSPAKVKRGFTWTIQDGASVLATPKPGNAASFSASGTTITVASHGYETGMVARLTTTGTLPTGLSTGTTYGIRVLSSSTFSLHASGGDAIDNTSPISTSGGSGTHTITPHTELVHFASVFGATSAGRYQWLQGGGSKSAEATLRWQHDKTYLRSTKTIPSWHLTRTPTAFTTHSYVPNGKGPLRVQYGDTGGHPQIGVQPQWCATHFMLQSSSQEQTVRVAALSTGHIPMCVRASGTGTIPVLTATSGTPFSGLGTATSSMFWWTSSTSGFTAPTGDLRGCIAAFGFDHWGGSAPYYAALITGEPQYDDLMVEAGNQAILNQATSFRNFTSPSNFYGTPWRDPYQTRTDAWASLTMGLAAALNTETLWDAAGLHSYVQARMTNAYAAIVAYNAAQPTFWKNNGIYDFRVGFSDGIISPWMNAYMLEVTALVAAATGDADAATFLNHLAKFPAALDASLDIWFYPAYRATIADSSGAMFTAFNQIHWAVNSASFNATTNVITIDPDGALTLTDGDTCQFYSDGNLYIPGGVTRNTTYYIRDTSDPGATSNKTFKVAATAGGTAIDLTGSDIQYVGFRPSVVPAGQPTPGSSGDDQYHTIIRGALRLAEAAGATGLGSTRTKMDTYVGYDGSATFTGNPINDMEASF